MGENTYVDIYDFLNLESEADMQTVKKQLTAKLEKYHPDVKNPNDVEENLFEDVVLIRTIMYDDKETYDDVGHITYMQKYADESFNIFEFTGRAKYMEDVSEDDEITELVKNNYSSSETITKDTEVHGGNIDSHIKQQKEELELEPEKHEETERDTDSFKVKKDFEEYDSIDELTFKTIIFLIGKTIGSLLTAISSGETKTKVPVYALIIAFLITIVSLIAYFLGYIIAFSVLLLFGLFGYMIKKL